MEVITIEQIESMLNMYNDLTLIKPNESPNGNIIYHLYEDGSLTYQKGGFAYKQRSEFTSLDGFGKINNLKFPNNKTYVVITEEHAIEIRKLMILYKKQLLNLIKI